MFDFLTGLTFRDCDVVAVVVVVDDEDDLDLVRIVRLRWLGRCLSTVKLKLLKVVEKKCRILISTCLLLGLEVVAFVPLDFHPILELRFVTVLLTVNT